MARRIHWSLDYPGVQAKGCIELKDIDLFDMTDGDIKGHLDDHLFDAVHSGLVHYNEPELARLIKAVEELDEEDG